MSCYVAINFEGILLLSKGNAKGRERLAEVRFVIDSCRVVSQSNHLKNSNKDCDFSVLYQRLVDS